MLQLQCTQKTFKFMGRKPQNLPEEPNETPLGVWYAKAIDIGGMDYLIFVNDPTLYAVLVNYLYTIMGISIEALFKDQLFAVLTADGVSEMTARTKIEALDPTIFTKTSSRSILGTMNDLVYNLSVCIRLDYEASSLFDLVDIQKKLNRIPHRYPEWGFADEKMREVLQGP